MPNDPLTGIRVVGDPVDDAERWEEQLYQVVVQADDRATGSDELATHISDWPTRYHLSRLRANLLRPLRFGPGLRVLCTGAGTGALARYLGESGASVVALERRLAQARIAAARCDGLPDVEVVCGVLADLDDGDGFDVVVAVGVLEWDGAELLSAARRLTRPDGALVAAIANQLGLKYLLGYAEDHRGVPWVGVEGFPGPEGARTYSRLELAGLLDEAGFPPRRWLYPFPDHTLPTAVLDQRAYERADADTFVDQLVGRPVVDHVHPRVALCDDRAAHRQLLRAGLGPDVANSFLVVAGTGETADRVVSDDAVAWHFGGDRLRLWLRTKAVVEEGGELVVDVTPAEGGVRHELGWLRQDPGGRRRWDVGPTIEQLALDACADHDADGLASLLQRWRGFLREQEVDRPDDDEQHPFLPAGSPRALPAPYLDVNLGNFVVVDDRTLGFVDAEWELPGGAAPDLVCLRALWFFAESVITAGAEHPWPLRTTVDELAETLGVMASVPVTAERLDDWRQREAALQSRVIGGEPDDIARHLAFVGRSSRLDPHVAGRLPIGRLWREVTRLAELEEERGERMRLADELELLRKRSRQLDELDETHRRVVHHLENVQADAATLRAERDQLKAAVEPAQAEVAAWVARWDQLERRLSMRIFRAFRRLLG